MRRERNRRIVIAGQLPPPFGGQNIMIDRILKVLKCGEDLDVLHLRIEFSKSVRSFRRFGWAKAIEPFRVLGRLLKMRVEGPLDLLVFPTGGPYPMSMARDFVLLPIIRFFAKEVWVQFHAAGIARVLPQKPGWLQWAMRLLHSCVTGAIVMTKHGKQDPLALGIDRIEVVPNGLEDHAREAGMRGGEVTTILGVGHLSEAKGTPYLVEAFGRIAEEFPTLKLRLTGEFGDDYTREQLMETAERFGIEDRIELGGLVTGEALFDEYGNADLFVFSSIAPFESFGMVMVEALMSGLPVVALDWKANREVLTDDFGGVVASLEPGQVEKGLEAGLREALAKQDQWPEWGARNRRVFEEHYSLNCLERNWFRFLNSRA